MAVLAVVDFQHKLTFYTRQQKFKDPKLQQYCFGNENCHRIKVLCSVGSLEDVSGNNACCDVCTPRYSICGIRFVSDTETKKVPFSAESWESNH